MKNSAFRPQREANPPVLSEAQRRHKVQSSEAEYSRGYPRSKKTKRPIKRVLCVFEKNFSEPDGISHGFGLRLTTRGRSKKGT